MERKMFDTPLQRTKLSANSLLRPRRSTQRGQAVSILADSYQSSGWVRKATGTVTDELSSRAWLGAAWAQRGIEGGEILLVFSDLSALVGWTEHQMDDISQMGQEGCITFSPLALSVRGGPLVFSEPLSTSPGRVLPLRVAADVEPHLRARISEVVKDAKAMGPVRAPWSSPPGALVAPWISGARNSDVAKELTLACAQFAGLLEQGKVISDLFLHGVGIDDQGRLCRKDLSLYYRRNDWSYDTSLVANTWLHRTLNANPDLWPHVLAQGSSSEPVGHPAWRRGSAISARVEWETPSAHDRLHARFLLKKYTK